MENSYQAQPAALVRQSVTPHIERGQYSQGPYGYEPTDSLGSDSGLIEYWRILRRNKLTIVLSALAGLVLGFAAGIPMKAVYRVKTTLEVLAINEDFMNLKQANPNTTNDNTYDTSEEQTEAKLLQSTSLLNKVISKLDPNSRPMPSTPLMAKSGWRALLHMSEPIELSARQKLLLKASDSIKVRPTVKTRVLEVTIDSPDPQLAADFANTLTKEFISQNVEARWATTQQTSEWLHRELDDARDKLRKSEAALQSYATSSGLIFTDETTNVSTEKLQQLQQNLSAATSDRIGKQSRYELAQNAPADSLADVISDSGLRDTESKINELRRQIADMSAIYNPEYSKIKRLQAELDEMQPVFEKQRADILSRIKNDFVEASRKERLLQNAYNAQASEVTGQDEKAIQYNILKRDVDSNRQLYDTMLQQMKQASIASALRASNVRVVDPATLPDSPVSPNFKVNSALGLLAGLLISIGAVTIREHADRTFHQPGDVKLWTEITELGVIPSASAASFGGYNRLPSRLKIQSEESKDSLVQWESPSIVAEAFRSTLTSVLFMAETADQPKVLVFTSAGASEGKTTVTSNLAIAAAEIRLKVLIIDADLRRPRMQNIFKLDNETGLADMLRDGSDLSTVSQTVQKTQIANLSVLTAGPATHSASHLLYSPAWGALLNHFRAEYDMILVDTPPMLQITDARVASRLADAVILVCRSTITTRDALLAAKGRLSEDRTRVLGVVLNDWNPKTTVGGYYGYYKDPYKYASKS
jgi:capsular exopolysaccharide synthesis family protein